jgi:hypothetical protein
MSDAPEFNPIASMFLKVQTSVSLALAGAMASNSLIVGGVVGGVGLVASEAKTIIDFRHVLALHRAASMWRDIWNIQDVDTEAVRAVINDETSNPAFVAVVLESVRSVENIVDPAVLPAIGIITRDYLKPLRKPDTFSRALSQVLINCDAEGLTDLRDVVETSRNKAGGFHARTFVTVHAPRSMKQDTRVGVRHREPATIVVTDGTSPQTNPIRFAAKQAGVGDNFGHEDATGTDERRIDAIPYNRAMRVVQRLSTIGIGMPRPENGSESVAVLADEMGRLASVLGKQPAQ